MSYDIIYSKQFVRLRKTGEVIPMLLSGSSNCYEVGLGGRNGRRSRSWGAMTYYNRKGKLSEKPGLLLKKVDADLNRIIRRHQGDEGVRPAQVRAHFGYYASLVVGSGSCGGTSWNDWRGVFANGIKKALTIEELHKLGVNLYFHAFGDNHDGRPASARVKTEQEYFIELKKWRQWSANGGSHFYLSFSPFNTDWVLDRLRAGRRKAPRDKARVEQDHYFVLADGGNMLVRYNRRGYRYTLSATDAKRFRTEKDAERYRRQLAAKGRYKAEVWKVERIEGNATFQV